MFPPPLLSSPSKTLLAIIPPLSSPRQTLWHCGEAPPSAPVIVLSPSGTIMAIKDCYRRMFNYGVEVESYRRWSAGNLATGAATRATFCSLVHSCAGMVRFASNYWKDFERLKPMVASIGGVQPRTFLHHTLAFGIHFGSYDSLKPVTVKDSFLGCFALSWAACLASQVPKRPIVSVRSKVEAGGGKETMWWKEFRGVHAGGGEGRRGGFAQGDQPPLLCCGSNSALLLIWCSACFSNAMVID